MGGKGHLVAFFVQFFLGVSPPPHREAALDHGPFEYVGRKNAQTDLGPFEHVGRKMRKWTTVRLNMLTTKSKCLGVCILVSKSRCLSLGV